MLAEMLVVAVQKKLSVSDKMTQTQSHSGVCRSLKSQLFFKYSSAISGPNEQIMILQLLRKLTGRLSGRW